MERSSSKSQKFFLFFMLLALAFTFGCQKKGETSRKVKQKGGIPVLSLAAFEKTLQAQKGHVLVVNFFATWCEPCRKELPDLIKLANRYKSKGVVVIGISLDKGGTKVLRPFLEKIKIPYPIYLANQALMDDLMIDAIPTTYFYDKTGRRVESTRGLLHLKDFEKKIEALLKSP